jgi:hypothetical protein
MRTYFYSKELDYELKKEITELQMAYNYIEELKTAIIASMSE